MVDNTPIDLILFHHGCPLPAHVQWCLKQIRIFNPDINIHFLAELNHPFFDEYNCKFVNLHDYRTPDIDTYIRGFRTYGERNFWTVSATRFFYIRNYMRKAGLDNVYHIENDIMLYYDLREFHKTFTSLPGLSVTPCEPNQSTTGFMHIRSASALGMMLEWFVMTVTSMNDAQIRKTYGMEMVNEMSLMKSYGMSEDSFSNLPIMPLATDFMPQKPCLPSSLFGDTLFDPATYGQYVGGTPAGDLPGIRVPSHYIGKMLLQYPAVTVEFHGENGRRIPYLSGFDNYLASDIYPKINNLHIHKKTLERFLS